MPICPQRKTISRNLMTSDSKLIDAVSVKESEYWEDHWDQYAEATRLNPAQPFRRKLVYRLLGLTTEQSKSATILDVGCGTGDMLMALERRYPNARFAGIDRSQTGLDVTAKKNPNAQVSIVDLASSATPHGELVSWASHAVCSEVLEHVEDPISVLKQLSHFIKPGGSVSITVPGGPKSAFDRSIGHITHYTPALITQQLESAGYTVELAAGAGFPTFNLYRFVILLRGERLNDDIDGSPSLLARFAMATFRVLLKFNFFNTPWGWQIIARARKSE